MAKLTASKDLIVAATGELFDKRDVTVVDRYWSTDYVEHSTRTGSGLRALRHMVGELPNGFRHEPARLLSEDDLVVTHGLYHGFGPEPMAGFDVWRVANGMIVEHWDAFQAWVSANPSGHSMTDGPTEVTEPAKTVANKRVVERFVEAIMMGGDRSQLPGFFDGDRYIQHNPVIADGVSGLGEAIMKGVWPALVERCVRVVADGEFVFTQSDGSLDSAPTAFYDLFRVEDDRLVEHWDVVFPKPERLPHDNGLF